MTRSSLCTALSLTVVLTACATDEFEENDPYAAEAGGKADSTCGERPWSRSVARSGVQAVNIEIGVSAAGRPWLAYAVPQPSQTHDVFAGQRGPDGRFDKQLIGSAYFDPAIPLAVEPSGAAHLCSANWCRDASADGVWGDPIPFASRHQLARIVGLTTLSVAPDGGLLVAYSTHHWSDGGNYSGPTNEFDAGRVAYRPPGLRSFFDVFEKTFIGRQQYPMTFSNFDQNGGVQLTIDSELWRGPAPDAELVHPGIGLNGKFEIDQDGRPWGIWQVSESVTVGSTDVGYETPAVQVIRGRGADHAFDSQGRLHIVAIGSDNSPIHTVRNSDGEWLVERIDVENVDAASPSLAIDSSDRLHVAYQDRTTGNLVYASRCPGM